MRFNFFGLSLGLLLLGCSSTPDTTTTITRPELVAVSPDDFMGDLRCGDAKGLVGSYVATLFDMTTTSDGGPTPESGFPLPSSPATACEFPVTFTRVLAGHRYRALIEAYDRRPQVAEPDGSADPDPTHIGAVSVGGRLQQDGTGAPVAPRWTALCGGYPDLDAGTGVIDSADALPGVTSYDALTTSVHDCPDGLQLVK